MEEELFFYVDVLENEFKAEMNDTELGMDPSNNQSSINSSQGILDGTEEQ
jgi:hypothetical protein